MKLVLTLCATALLALAADVKSEIAALQDAMDKANSAKDGDAYGKHLTPGYVGVTRSGAVRDRTATINTMKNGPSVPPDLKREILSTVIYGDAVVQLGKETATSSKGDKIQAHVTLVYIKQANVWKLASRSSTNIQPAP